MLVVLSVAKLTPGQEGYYERSVAAGHRRLLRGPRRVAGHLDGPRRPRARARGRRRGGPARSADPRRAPAARGKQLRTAHPQARTITIERIDPATGERRTRGEEAATGRGLRPRLLGSRRASACCTRSATRRRAGPSTRRTPPPGRPRSPTSRTRPASSAAAPDGVVARARRRASSPPPTSTAPRARRTRTCTRT